MIKQYRYYVIDDVTEKIIGGFFASSDAMATRILKGFDVNKAKLTWNDVSVLKDPNGICEYESLSELRSLKRHQIVNFPLDDVVNGQLIVEVNDAE